MMMPVHINGEPHLVEDGWRLEALLADLDLSGSRIAVEVNEEVVPASRRADTVLAAGDCIEIVHAIGGG
ncbi:sulfur carrier protein ThiS [Halomonas nitroreducens]|uniref:Sulfur carrier protein ThiS n=1 Tax=Halomonas nitroreducens TaxID=447425 RepID=A0A431V051_9GAMM|nr:sulfur carrier protein ThiS [Halomonas nitroreducens]RTR00436.1 sulfur carrier protein ThiS [Halomonas nitroreducens]